MRRSAKLGLYGVALLGLIAGILSFTTSDRAIAISVDGKTNTVHTTAATVRGVLHDAKLKVGPHDVVAPAPAVKVHKGSVIELRRGRLLHLNVDGVSRDVWTTDTTVDQALADLGYGQGRTMGVSRSDRLPLSPTELTLVMPKQVTIVADKKAVHVVTTAPTVQDAVQGAHLALASTDRLTPAATVKPTAGMTIVLTRVRMKTVTGTQAIPYPTSSKKDPSAYQGSTTVVKPGKPGKARVTFQLVYVDGKLSGKRVVTSTVLVKPVTRIQKVGTKSVEAAAASSPAAAQALGRTMAAAKGWGSGQFSCLLSLWTKESGWRVSAANPSGAYGIPQALPGGKMASAGPNWQSNARTQIAWGLGYIARVYGSPCAAWGHSQATNWY